MFHDDNTLDIAAAAGELRATSHLSNLTEADRQRDIIKTAALLDIAASLRGLAIGVLDERPDEPEQTGEGDVDDPIDVGDWVVPTGATENMVPLSVTAVSEREGELCIDYGNGWKFASGFTKVGAPDLIVAKPADPDDDPTLSDLTDDVDADFDTPVTSEGAEATCDAWHRASDDGAKLLCSRKHGHKGKHRDDDGDKW